MDPRPVSHPVARLELAAAAHGHALANNVSLAYEYTVAHLAARPEDRALVEHGEGAYHHSFTQYQGARIVAGHRVTEDAGAEDYGALQPLYRPKNGGGLKH